MEGSQLSKALPSLAQLPKYRYIVLDESQEEIRLLTILPGTFNDIVHTQLHIRPFPHDGPWPQFEALSYTWGSVENPGQIIIDGDGSLSITRNLYEALPYLRHVTEPRTIWIDAICVNQQDIAERSSQVKRMADIYTRASRVVVWLGPASANSDHALDLLEDLGSQVVIDWVALTMMSSQKAVAGGKEHFSDFSIPMKLSNSTLRALLDIFLREWFERLWIWQEVQLASENAILTCGSKSIPWELFRNALYMFQKKSIEPGSNDLFESFLHRKILIFSLCEGIQDTMPTQLIFRTQRARCTDPKDRIYALLSFININQPNISIVPDYSKELLEIYEEACMEMIKNISSLKFLTTIELGAEETSNIIQKRRRWCPDWSKVREAYPILGLLAASNSRPSYSFKEYDILQVSGVVAGKIERIQTFSFQGIGGLAGQNIYEKTARVVISTVKKFMTAEIPCTEDILALSQVLCSECVAELFEPSNWDYLGVDEVEQALKNLLAAQDDQIGEEANTSLTIKYLERVGTWCPSRAIFAASHGKIGLAPKAATLGDLVVVLLGCDTPLILRELGNSQYLVVGECFCDELMSGAALLGALPENIEPVILFDPDEKCHKYAFLDRQQNVYHLEDPRLESIPLPGDWMLEVTTGTRSYNLFVNKTTGATMETDPRLDEEQLLRRGVKIQKFDLI